MNGDQDRRVDSSEFIVLSFKKKGGDTRPPPSLADKGSYRFLPPFFAPPFLAVFLAMRYPPLRVGLFARSSHCVAAPRPSARRPALSALSPGCLSNGNGCPRRGSLPRVACVGRSQLPCVREASIKKKGVSSLDTPGPAGGLALLPALFRAALFRRLLRH